MRTSTTGTIDHLFNMMVRSAAVTLFAAAATVGLQAQSSGLSSAYSPLNLKASLAAPLSVGLSSPDVSNATESSSSSSVSSDPVATERLNLGTEATQPPPRRRYGRPRYNDNMHNADGSNKYAFLVGAGFTAPIGNTHKYLTPSYKFQVGAGRNFDKNFGLIAQFDWDNFGFQTNNLNNQLALYNSLGATDSNGNALTSLGGTSHVWSVSLNPTYTFAQGEKSGVYVVAGVGFYHKTANFTIPGIGVSCDPYYGCFQYAANQTIDKYTSNAPGFNGGIGFTYKPSRFANEKLFAEARYVFVDNTQRTYSGITSPSANFNAYPANSNRTGYIPVTVGVRW